MQYLLLYKVIKRQLQRIKNEKSLRSGKYKSRVQKSCHKAGRRPPDIIGIPSGLDQYQNYMIKVMLIGF